jgi:hypothetical protein
LTDRIASVVERTQVEVLARRATSNDGVDASVRALVAAVGCASVEVIAVAVEVKADKRDAGVDGTEQVVITVAVGEALRCRRGGAQHQHRQRACGPELPNCESELHACPPLRQRTPSKPNAADCRKCDSGCPLD